MSCATESLGCAWWWMSRRENIQEQKNNRTKCTQSSYVDFRFAIPEEVARIEIGGIEREMATM